MFIRGGGAQEPQEPRECEGQDTERKQLCVALIKKSSFRCLRKKRPLRKFDAKASVEVRSIATDTFFARRPSFRYEAISNDPAQLKKPIF